MKQTNINKWRTHRVFHKVNIPNAEYQNLSSKNGWRLYKEADIFSAIAGHFNTPLISKTLSRYKSSKEKTEPASSINHFNLINMYRIVHLMIFLSISHETTTLEHI